MGLFSGILSTVASAFTKKKSSDSAADAQVEAARIASEELKRQFDLARSDLQPFVAAGTGALSQIQNGATVAGMDERIRSLANSETFGALRDERLRGVTSHLGAVGLRRSGAAAEEIANLDTSLLLGLENDLFARQSGLATNAQNAAGGQAAQAINTGNSLASLQVGAGDAIAAGRVAGGTALSQGIDSLGSLLTAGS